MGTPKVANPTLNTFSNAFAFVASVIHCSPLMRCFNAMSS